MINVEVVNSYVEYFFCQKSSIRFAKKSTNLWNIVQNFYLFFIFLKATFLVFLLEFPILNYLKKKRRFC